MLSLLRTGADGQKVLAVISQTEALLEADVSDERRIQASPLEIAGYRAVTSAIRRAVLAGQQVDLDAIDPFPAVK